MSRFRNRFSPSYFVVSNQAVGTILGLALLAGLGPIMAEADDLAPQVAEVKLPEISDEPKLIDPATIMPEKLAASATVDLSESSLREMIEWLRNDQKFVVLTDNAALADAGVQSGEPISDRLDNAPIYLLLNRLRASGLAWYFEDDILHITSSEAADEHMTTIPYNLGDLLDAGYDADSLITVIESAIAPDSWATVGGSGVLNFLGDVMFLRQNGNVHRQVEAFLMAIRQHGRQTFVLDPSQHLALRQKLTENVNVDFDDTPLDTAIKELADKLDIDIRLDVPALRDIRVRERQPVTLKLTNQTLKTVLQAMVIEFDLTWVLRDGVLWITSTDSAEAFLKTALYDVRDLCRDESESDALREAVVSQTNPDSWDEVGGPGTIQFAQPGILVINHQETVHLEVLTLLESYRAALRVSKPRDRNAADPNELFTLHYRLHANVAEGLIGLLPKFVQPDTWVGGPKPESKGSISLTASPSELFGNDGTLARLNGKNSNQTQSVVVARSVLIIKQTRKVHDEIGEFILRVEAGNANFRGGKFGGGFGGGGFGGDFFSLPKRAVSIK
jgi:hypothetical protein